MAEQHRSVSCLPLVLTDVQCLVFKHPVDVRLGVAGCLTVKDGRVALVHGCILWFHLKTNVHYMCTTINKDMDIKTSSLIQHSQHNWAILSPLQTAVIVVNVLSVPLQTKSYSLPGSKKTTKYTVNAVVFAN